MYGAPGYEVPSREYAIYAWRDWYKETLWFLGLSDKEKKDYITSECCYNLHCKLEFEYLSPEERESITLAEDTLENGDVVKVIRPEKVMQLMRESRLVLWLRDVKALETEEELYLEDVRNNPALFERYLEQSIYHRLPASKIITSPQQIDDIMDDILDDVYNDWAENPAPGFSSVRWKDKMLAAMAYFNDVVAKYLKTKFCMISENKSSDIFPMSIADLPETWRKVGLDIVQTRFDQHFGLRSFDPLRETRDVTRLLNVDYQVEQYLRIQKKELEMANEEDEIIESPLPIIDNDEEDYSYDDSDIIDCPLPNVDQGVIPTSPLPDVKSSGMSSDWLIFAHC